jgi:Na+/H+ antiporter NhaD/arsenite permease-like protein
MTAGLTLILACQIVSIPDGLKGFANEGVLTVMALFVVAEGLSRTGALDYYLGLILGNPKTIPGAQIRLMIPIATLSAFLNSTLSTPRRGGG